MRAQRTEKSVPLRRIVSAQDFASHDAPVDPVPVLVDILPVTNMSPEPSVEMLTRMKRFTSSNTFSIISAPSAAACCETIPQHQ